jgi:hypothetical protein
MIKKTAAYFFGCLPHPAQVFLRHRFIYRYLRKTQSTTHYRLKAADQLRCIFIHVPKCAGVSISQTLFGSLGGSHLRAADYQTIYSKREYNEYFKFAFVRNPWDRLASAFFFLKSGGINEGNRNFAQKHLCNYNNFEQFVTEWVTPKNVMRYFHFQPQTHFLCIGDNPPCLNFIGYYENLADDFRYVQKRLGITKELAVLNQTSGKHPDYRTLYNQRMIDIVAKVYARDIALLGYQFDNANLHTMLAVRPPT